MSGGEDAAVILAASGNVEQAKQNALGADAEGVVEISGNAFAHEDGRDVGPLDLGEDGGHGLGGGSRAGALGVKERAHGKPKAKLAQERVGGKRKESLLPAGAALTISGCYSPNGLQLVFGFGEVIGERSYQR